MQNQPHYSYLIQLPIFIIDCIVKSDVNQLGHILGLKPSRNEGSINGAKAVGQSAIGVITRWSSVGIVGGVAPTFVTPIKTI